MQFKKKYKLHDSETKITNMLNSPALILNKMLLNWLNFSRIKLKYCTERLNVKHLPG